MKVNNSAAKVGEIFTEAGAAFNKLADMVMMLHPLPEITAASQVRAAVKRKVTDDKPLNTTGVTTTSQPSQQVTPITQQATLNMANSPAAEMEVETLKDEVKIEFEGRSEEVAS